MNSVVVCFNGSHNSTIVLAKNNQIVDVLELERFWGFKNTGVQKYKHPPSCMLHGLMHHVKDYLFSKHNIQQIDVLFHDYGANVFTAKKTIRTKHHLSHAAGCFYQSPYQEAIVFTADGGGNDGVFNVYLCERGLEPRLIQKYPYDLGFSYMIFGDYLHDIKQEKNIHEGSLVYAGKIMGLVSYGKVQDNWLPHFVNFFKANSNAHNVKNNLKILSQKIDIELDTSKRLQGETAFNVVATLQRAFEEVLIECIAPFANRYPSHPFGFAGGCALNILANTRLKKHFNRSLFIPPDPNDCGIALGMMLNYLRPAIPFDATYSGQELYDKDAVGQMIVSKKFNSCVVDIQKIAHKIYEGDIIGIARGRSEHGPRALGNRSIICNPCFPQMKEILNSKVKHREWYRPFAPVVRLEDVNTYFEWSEESRWMSFAPLVRKEFRNVIPSITHVDNTARVQTVTREQNQFIYDLITAVGELSGIYVLLNTSFNVDGKPILATASDAFQILSETEIGGIIVNDLFITK